jgi:hypothetical protein
MQLPPSEPSATVEPSAIEEPEVETPTIETPAIEKPPVETKSVRKPPKPPKSEGTTTVPALARTAASRCRKLADAAAVRELEASFTIASSGATMLASTRPPHDRGALADCVEKVIAGAKFPAGTLRATKLTVKFGG